LPAVNFGNDIEYNAPQKPFIVPVALQEQDEGVPIPEPAAALPQQQTASFTGSAAIYDRNWLLQ